MLKMHLDVGGGGKLASYTVEETFVWQFVTRSATPSHSGFDAKNGRHPPPPEANAFRTSSAIASF